MYKILRKHLTKEKKHEWKGFIHVTRTDQELNASRFYKSNKEDSKNLHYMTSGIIK